MSPSLKAQEKIKQYLQYRINALKQEMAEMTAHPSSLLTDRDLSIYECMDYMLTQQAHQIEDLAHTIRIETLARYCVEQQHYFSTMNDFFQAVNASYIQMIHACAGNKDT